MITDKPQTLGDLNCMDEQVPKFDGTDWFCSDMNSSPDSIETYSVNGNVITVFDGHTFDRTSIAMCNPGDKVISGGWTTTD